MKKFYTVYKITNLINGKIYFGQHITKDLLDDYMGSGTDLKYDIIITRLKGEKDWYKM